MSIDLIAKINAENDVAFSGYTYICGYDTKDQEIVESYGKVRNVPKDLSTGRERFDTTSHFIKDDVLSIAIYVQEIRPRRMEALIALPDDPSREKDSTVILVFESFENLAKGIDSNEICLRTTLKPVLKNYLAENKPDYFYCSNVPIFRDCKANNYNILENPILMSIIFVSNEKVSKSTIQEAFETGLRQGHNNIVIAAPKIGEDFTSIFGQVMAHPNIVRRYKTVSFIHYNEDDKREIIIAFQEEKERQNSEPEATQMFTTDITDVVYDEEDKIRAFRATFNVYVAGRMIYSFTFPCLHIKDLESFVRGEDHQDQDDDGFHIEQKDKKVTITIQPNNDGDNKKDSKIYLTHQECKSAFNQLIAKKVYNNFDLGNFENEEDDNSE